MAEYLSALKDAGVKVVCANANVRKESSLLDLFGKSTLVKANQAGHEITIGIIGFIGIDTNVSKSYD